MLYELRITDSQAGRHDRILSQSGSEQGTGQRNSSLADITMVYDQPIRLTAEILSELQDKERNETELKTIQDIKTKYCTYQGYILSQLDEEICEKLVDDLKRLSE